jgi:hypothetical protein
VLTLHSIGKLHTTNAEYWYIDVKLVVIRTECSCLSLNTQIPTYRAYNIEYQFLPSHKIRNPRCHNSESCVLWPTWICNDPHICTAFRNIWITLTNRSKVFSVLVSLSFVHITCLYTWYYHIITEPGYLSQYSVWLWTGRPGDRGSIPARCKRLFL